MTSWRERGGWPLAVASLSLAAGIMFGVQTVKVEQVAPEDPDPPTTTPPITAPTVTADDFALQVAEAVVAELDLPPSSTGQIVELLTDDGQPGVIVVPPTTTTRPPATPTTTTVPPTTTTPREIIVPTIEDIVDLVEDNFVPTTVP